MSVDCCVGRLLDALDDALAEAILAGDQAALVRAVEPALRRDQSLMAWLSHPATGPWLDQVLAAVRRELQAIADASPAAPPPAADAGPGPAGVR